MKLGAYYYDGWYEYRGTWRRRLLEEFEGDTGRIWETNMFGKSLSHIAEDGLNAERCRIIRRTREKTAAALKELGFEMTDSKANFLFARHPSLDGGELYTNLKSRGILVRHWDLERIRQYNRITVGTEEQMDALVAAVRDILEEAQ